VPRDKVGMTDFTGRTVLVTGGAGFVGSHLVGRLRAHGAQVRTLDDLSNGRRSNLDPDVPLMVGDVRDEATRRAALAGVDIVFHMAAQINPVLAVSEPMFDFDVNARGTLGLLVDAERAGVKRLILSSTNLYGDAVADGPCTEDLPSLEIQQTLLSPYAASKLTAEAYCQLFSDTGRLETVRLRYSNVYGTRQRDAHGSGVLGIFSRAALEGRPLEIHGDGEQTRDFVHVSDVVRANLLAASSPNAVGQAINVASGIEETVNNLARRILALTGGRTVTIPERVASFRRASVSINKAEQLLGWRPAQSLQQGLEEYLDWLREDLCSAPAADIGVAA
jgi:UDP-glucose 4-epimerase